MKCPKCKREINDNSSFCEFCGNKIKRLKWPYVLLIVVAVIAVILLILMRYNENMSAKAEEQRLYDHCVSANDYRYYVSKYPNGEYVMLANNMIRQYVNDSIKAANEARIMELTAFNNCNSANACRNYLQHYPQGMHADTIRNKLNEYVQDSIKYNMEMFDAQAEDIADKVGDFVAEFSRATVENDYDAISRLYANGIRRYYNEYDVDREHVLERYKEYDEMFGVYGKYSNVRGNTFEIKIINDEIYLTYIEDYSIDRYDKTGYSKFVLKKHIILNLNYEIISIYDDELEKRKNSEDII